jgi:hypothetical protein
MQPNVINVELDGSSDSGPCSCCGNMSRTVWGYLYHANKPIAAYYVHWTLGRVDHGANFDLVVGSWGEGTSSKDRAAVAVAFRQAANGPQFMVIDAEERPAASAGALANRAMRPDQVIGTPLATEVFAMLDAIWLCDPRIGELATPVP